MHSAKRFKFGRASTAKRFKCVHDPQRQIQSRRGGGWSIMDRLQSKWDQRFAPSECGEGQPSDDRRGETESAPTRHRRRDHRNVIIIVGMTKMKHIQNWCVIEDDQEIASHRASRSAPAHCRRPQGQWHHNTVIIRSGRRSVSNSKSL